ISRPLNWLGDELEWRLGDGAGPLDPRRPVIHVSWFEADAFARSRDLRLPSEVEWEAAAIWDGSCKDAADWTTPGAANLIESGVLGTTPVGSRPASPCGAQGMIGDVWEWTSSRFGGYPGF